MPRITKQDWRNSKKRSTRRPILIGLGLLILFSAAIPASFLLTAPGASAVPSTGPDVDDFQGRSMTFVVDNGVYVGANEIVVKLYYDTPLNNAADIHSAGLTDAPSYDTIYTNGGGDPVVVDYELFEGAITPSSVPIKTCAAKVTQSLCTWTNIDFSQPPNPSHGFYEATLRARVRAGSGWEFSNGFWVVLPPNQGDIVGYDSNSTADKFAMQERVTDDLYTDWTLKFGADCSVIDPAGKISTFVWYDPDSGDPQTQPQNSSFTIDDVTTGAPVRVDLFNPRGSDFSGPSPATLSAANRVTPGGGSKTSGLVDFTALPQHIYEIHWDHVWSNNTLQFQLPYDSIFYFTSGCATGNYNVALSATSNPLQSVPAATVAPGSTITIVPQLQNNGAVPTTGGVLQVMFPGDQYSQTKAPTSMTPLTIGVPVGGSLGYSPTSKILPQAPGENWYWDVGALGAGASTFGSLTFTVPVTAPALTFDVVVWYTPPKPGGAPIFVRLRFKVVSTRSPALSGSNSDIHAGGCIPTTGNITTRASSGSYGQYVISHSGSSFNIESNNRIGDSLNLGTNQPYTQVCRPDLLAAAQKGRTAGLGTQLTTNDVDLATLTADDFYYYVDNGAGDLNLHGQVPRKLTVVALNGNVRITGDIRLDTGTHSIQTLPSLGIIASGDIYIDPVVTRISAYLFSNGVIDTCNAPLVNCASPTLIVNGFLMAKDIRFARLGPFNTSSSPGNPVYGEQVILNPQLYLNPPRFFDASTDNAQVEGQGERPPLF